MEPEKIVLKDRTEYHLNGELHREDGPAVIWNDGTEVWCLHGKYHRENGPAIHKDGREAWCLHGQVHREDGPARIYHDGTKEWYIEGHIHREDGPAVIKSDGTEEWYIEGTRLTEKEVETAKQILSGEYPFEDLPLLINHPTLKYFAIRKLGTYGT